MPCHYTIACLLSQRGLAQQSQSFFRVAYCVNGGDGHVNCWASYRMSGANGIDLRFNGGRVGVLDTESLPDDAGVISYMPYRSGSHYLLHCAIAEGQTPTCTFMREGVEFAFVVESSPGYGQLRIRDLRRV